MQIAKTSEVSDEQLKKVFEDYQEIDPDIYESRNVDGWSFVQGAGQGANAGNH